MMSILRLQNCKYVSNLLNLKRVFERPRLGIVVWVDLWRYRRRFRLRWSELNLDVIIAPVALHIRRKTAFGWSAVGHISNHRIPMISAFPHIWFFSITNLRGRRGANIAYRNSVVHLRVAFARGPPYHHERQNDGENSMLDAVGEQPLVRPLQLILYVKNWKMKL